MLIWTKEFSVVRNEMEIGENDPFRVLWKRLAAVSFDWHNYGNNTIGARADVEGVKLRIYKASTASSISQIMQY